MSSIFSEEALKKRRIPGDLAGPITLLTPPLKASLFLAFGLVAVGILWSIYARVPITIKAIGVLVPVSTIDSVSSKTTWPANPPACWPATYPPIIIASSLREVGGRGVSL